MFHVTLIITLLTIEYFIKGSPLDIQVCQIRSKVIPINLEIMKFRVQLGFRLFADFLNFIAVATGASVYERCSDASFHFVCAHTILTIFKEGEELLHGLLAL